MGVTLTHEVENAKLFVYVPEGFEGEPTSVEDVLRRGKAVLEEEGRWCRYNNYSYLNGPDDPFCGSWQACAQGAVGIVSGGVWRDASEPPNICDCEQCVGWRNSFENNQLFVGAMELLDDAAGRTTTYGIIGVNDAGSRASVLEAFDSAIELAQLKE